MDADEYKRRYLEEQKELNEIYRERPPRTPEEALVIQVMKDVAAKFKARQMFQPPLPGSLLAGRVICLTPDSDVKYGSFLEWWYAVGRKGSHELTTEDWSTILGPFVTEGQHEMIPKEDWDALSDAERQAICAWAEAIPQGVHYTL